MPSPVASSNFQPAPAHSASSSQTQDAPVLPNGSLENGAARESEKAASPGDGPAPSTTSDVIREGKEKAKAVMAASGLTVDQDNRSQSPIGAGSDVTTGAMTANGASPSRKRSRSGSRLPSQAPSHTPAIEKEQPSIHDYTLNRYVRADQVFTAAVCDQWDFCKKLFEEQTQDITFYKEMHQKVAMDPSAFFGVGYTGYGNGTTGTRPRLEYPAQRKRPGNRRSRPLHIKRADMAMQAEQLEELVPVRLDIEFDKIKLRDTFTWNLHDRVIPPDVFAENLVEDFKLPAEVSSHVAQSVLREMQEQIQDFHPHVFIEEEPLDPHLPYFAYKNDEMRILIKLNITIGQHTLVDQFEWEINNPLNSPEEFARQMAHDLSLSGEFTTAIAHSIREQCQMFTKSLYITGHPFDGRPIEDSDVRENFLPSPLPSVFRPVQSAKDFAPYLYELNETELEKAELSILREQRRQKRSVNRRGGPALPDLKDRQKTVRTLVVSSVLPGAAETIEGSRVFKVSRAASGRGRRAAGRNDGGEDSDESDSDDSVPDSPAPSQIMAGTARTRGIRGAATAAQAAMRANLGRSATPEVSHHHETRTSRRHGGYETREESIAEPSSLIVRLRISKDKLRRWAQAQRTGRTAEYQQGRLQTPLMATQSHTPQRHTSRTTSMPPPPSPALQQQQTPTDVKDATDSSSRAQSVSLSESGQQEWHYYPDGRVDAPYPLPANHTPAPPPPWLSSALQRLQEKYPHDLFEALMRYTPVDKTTGSVVRVDLAPGDPLPPNVHYQYLPRIRCTDCPGKLYTAGPGLTVDNFEIHLKNRQHKERVDARRKTQGSQ